MNPITRKEMFLAAAGGQDVTTPTPITREEVFLDEIAKGGGGSSLPSTETASAGDVLSLDDNKEPQWATPSGGGGVLVVHEDANNTLDKTYNEIVSAPFAIVRVSSGGFTTVKKLNMFGFDSGEYGVQFDSDVYTTESENDYPTRSMS